MSADLQEVLTALGYTNLSDRGNQWRCRPLYRDSDNSTSLCIFKDNGAFEDFGAAIKGTLKDLIRLTLGYEKQEDVEKFLNSLKYDQTTEVLRKPKLIMPTTFDSSLIENLLPHYVYWQKRGMRTDTLEVFGGGMAGEGPMLRRYVFPIWDEDQKQILGFAGRDLTNSPSRPKWKLMGAKKFWVYPLHINKRIITNRREAILVESIGDMLALFNAGYHHVLVMFGLRLKGTALFNRLISLNPKRIIVALNSDKNGQLAAERTVQLLGTVFDSRQIVNAPPLAGDFGEMLEQKIDFNVWYNQI